MIWRGLDPDQQADWSKAEKRANLSITGYNLFTYWITTGDEATIRTIERQSGVQLIPLHRMAE